MLDSSEVAAIARVHVETVRKWTRRGLIRAFQSSPAAPYRYDPAEIQRFLGISEPIRAELDAQEIEAAK
jgi:DNA-binding transcriptional MerR regulator